MKKTFRHIILAVISIILSGFLTTAASRDFVLVIDPGHGGKDYGAIGKITNEKTINLKVAKLLGDKITEVYDDVKIVYTRNSDKFISLKERANMANRSKGDLFISIHVNSLPKNNRKRYTISGASVYTLGLHKSADNLEVAKRENAVMELEDDFSESYSGFNPESSESYIIFELSQNKHMEQSVEFADMIQNELVETASLNDRGVRQAGFWVLWATGMPSVLVELDFICNPEREKFMHSEEGIENMADALFNAFSRFKATSGNRLSPAGKPKSSAASETRPEKSNSDQTFYKVQFLTSGKRLNDSSRELKGLKNVEIYKDDGLYKYTVGSFLNETDAETKRKEVAKLFPEAFIVVFRNGKRVR